MRSNLGIALHSRVTAYALVKCELAVFKVEV